MALRLVREASDTPNISNRDDACMVRYAYGGYDGIVKDFGQELSATVGSGKVTINSGRIVLQGWEVDVETENISVPESTTGAVYEHLYLELNLLLEEARLLTIRSTTTDFPLSLGDNLTQSTSGTARLPIYRWSVSGSTISGLTKVANVIPYRVTQQNNIDLEISDIKTRLDNMGFREGYIVLDSPFNSVSPVKNSVTVKGTYVIGALEYGTEQPVISIDLASGSFLTSQEIKIGKISPVGQSGALTPELTKFFPKEYPVGLGIKGTIVQDSTSSSGLIMNPSIDSVGTLTLAIATGPLGFKGRIQLSGLYFGYERDIKYDI